MVFAEALNGMRLSQDFDSVDERAPGRATLGDKKLTELADLFRFQVRFSRYALCDTYIRGYPPRQYDGVDPRPTDAKVFAVDTMVKLETPAMRDDFLKKFYPDMLPFHTRVMMPTGEGKTTKLPWHIAQRTSRRVLLLVPTVGLAHYASEGIRMNGGHATVRFPSRRVTVWVKTYADFVLDMAYGGYKRFSDWDVGTIIIDECHDNSAYAYATRILIATHLPMISVILTSATQKREHMQINAKVQTAPVYERGYDLSKLPSDPRWDEGGKWARDRMCVFLPGDSMIYEMRDKLEAKGHTVLMLDSASVWADVKKVVAALQGSSPTARILLALPKYGTGYSLPISCIVDSCVREAISYRDGHIVESLEPLTFEEKMQHAGRLGHTGDVKGTASVWFLSDLEAGGTAIRQGDRMLAWLLLRICHIRPRRDVFMDHVAVFGSEELSVYSASQFFTTPLPVELWVKLRAKDSVVARKFYPAVSQLCFQNQSMFRSDYDDPVDYEFWARERVGNYYGASDYGDALMVVPCKMPMAYRILSHGLYAMATNQIEVTFDSVPFFDADVSSDTEEEIRLVRARPRRLSEVRVPSKARVHLAVDTRERGFREEHLVSDDVIRRRMTVYDHKRGVLQFSACETSMEFSSEFANRLASSDVWLDDDRGRLLVHLVNPSMVRLFVASELFDRWSNVWICITDMLCDDGYLANLDRDNVTRCVWLLEALVRRFDRDVQFVRSKVGDVQVAVSGFKSFFTRLLGKRNAEVYKWIKQPKDFVLRVAMVHKRLQEAVRSLPAVNVYSPVLNQWAAKDVPWSGGSSRLGFSGAGLLGSRVVEVGEPERESGAII